MKILLVEDDQKSIAFIRKGLKENGFIVDVADNGDDGFVMAEQNEYDLIILDVMLPGTDGWSVLTRLRAKGLQVPALFLSARNSLGDKVKGLELGADDYLAKPFAFPELLARIRTILRRGPVRQAEVFRIGDLEVDAARCKASRRGTLLDLTAKEFMLLHLMSRRAGEVMTRKYIAEQVWDMNFDSESNVVDVHIHRLRTKVDDPFAERLIHTVRGIGYVLEVRP